jgi:hypothetical protein
VAVIADQAAVRIEIGVGDRAQRLASAWSEADPNHLARVHRRGEQVGERRIRVQQSVFSK